MWDYIIAHNVWIVQKLASLWIYDDASDASDVCQMVTSATDLCFDINFTTIIN